MLILLKIFIRQNLYATDLRCELLKYHGGPKIFFFLGGGTSKGQNYFTYQRARHIENSISCLRVTFIWTITIKTMQLKFSLQIVFV